MSEATMRYEVWIDDEGNVACDLGVIEHPWPARSKEAFDIVVRLDHSSWSTASP